MVEIKQPVSDSAVLVSQGHYYIFSSTGRYYISQLSTRYAVDIIVPEEYQNIDGFHASLKLINVRNVFYLNDTVYFSRRGNDSLITKTINFFNNLNLRRFSNFNREAKAIFYKWKYVAYVSHDYIEAEHLYIFHNFKLHFPNAPIIVMLSSQPSNENIFPAFRQQRHAAIRHLSRDFSLAYYPLLLMAYLGKYTQSILQNILFPMIILRKMRPYLGLSAFSNIDIVPRQAFFDKFLVHEDNEVNYHAKLFGSVISVEKVTHVISAENDLLSSFYGFPESNSISIFFSTLGLSGDATMKEELNSWRILVMDLLEKMPDYNINIKFHPGSSPALIERAVTFFRLSSDQKVSFFFGTKVSAEELIYKSKVIIGDCSSTLIWAQYLSDKLVYSLQIPGFSMYADMERYPKIFCSRNPYSIVKNICKVINSTSEKYAVEQPSPRLVDII
jgi:hypothetical protein